MSEHPPTIEFKWDDFRREMPVAQAWNYLDHAAVAPIPAPAQRAMTQWAGEASGEGASVWPQWSRRVEEVRASASQLIGAKLDEVALVQNTTSGISLVAEGLPWQPGDNVVTPDNEFPSNAYPWMNLQSRGVETRRVPVGDDGRVDLNRLAEACNERTRIVAISWVGFASGWRNDVAQLAALAHDRGALLFLDAIQGLGVFPLDVEKCGVDFLAADGHKWLLGPEGAGILYIRRDHLDQLRPMGLGWHSVQHEYDFDRIELELKPSAARYEGGSANMVGFIGLGASLKLLLDFGMSSISQRVLETSDYACQQLAAAGATIKSPREGDHRSGIVSFTWPGDMQSIRSNLIAQNILTSFRSGRLRISPHAYNTEDEIDRLVAALRNPT
jgi:selenocysteine lyase/cysteine desulfurase